MRIQTNIQKGLYINLIHEEITPNIPEIFQAVLAISKYGSHHLLFNILAMYMHMSKGCYPTVFLKMLQILQY